MADSVGNVDLLTTADQDIPALVHRLAALPNVVEVVEHTPESEHARIVLYGGLEVRLHVVPRTAWGSGLVWYTGSAGHVQHLQRLATARGWSLGPHGLADATGTRLAGETEVGVYERLDLPWIAPELREDQGEIEAAQAGSLPRLIEIGDVRGDLHSHTNWTDGAASLDEMARAARARGYAYLALTDHSQSLAMTRGLTPERLLEQRRLVDGLNHKLAPFTVLLGTEMDILPDGQLDFSDEVLQTLDYVSASVHSAFGQARPRMQTVVETAARVGCALELNATPDRLDLNGEWARRAKQAGARFTISSDSHAVRELDYLQFGIGSARRGWLTAEDVLNTRPLDELRALLAQRTA
jgi:DNA polymerase (family 10)